MIEPTLTSFVFLFSFFLIFEYADLRSSHFLALFLVYSFHLICWCCGAASPFIFHSISLLKLAITFRVCASNFQIQSTTFFFCYLCIAHNLKVAVSSPAFVLVPYSLISERKMRVRGRKMHTLLSCMQSFLCDLSFISDFANSFDGILTI